MGKLLNDAISTNFRESTGLICTTHQSSLSSIQEYIGHHANEILWIMNVTQFIWYISIHMYMFCTKWKEFVVFFSDLAV